MNANLRNQLTASLHLAHERSVRRMVSLREAIASGEVRGDVIELGREVADRNNAVEGIVATQTRLDQIAAALDRTKDGTYGFCVDCGVEIRERRLRALPWSERCISCQERAEMFGPDGSASAVAKPDGQPAEIV